MSDDDSRRQRIFDELVTHITHTQHWLKAGEVFHKSLEIENFLLKYKNDLINHRMWFIEAAHSRFDRVTLETLFSFLLTEFNEDNWFELTLILEESPILMDQKIKYENMHDELALGHFQALNKFVRAPQNPFLKLLPI